MPAKEFDALQNCAEQKNVIKRIVELSLRVRTSL